MVSYKELNLIQSILIFIVGFSVFDSGANIFEPYGFLLNYLLFDFIKIDFPLWGLSQFWGYCFFVVAVIQFMKTNKLEERFRLLK